MREREGRQVYPLYLHQDSVKSRHGFLSGPPDCLQYFTGTTGKISSFNYRTDQSTVGTTATHLSSQCYSACFRYSITVAGINPVNEVMLDFHSTKQARGRQLQDLLLPGHRELLRREHLGKRHHAIERGHPMHRRLPRSKTHVKRIKAKDVQNT